MELRGYLVATTLLIVGTVHGGTRGGRVIPYKAVIEYKGAAFCVGTVIDAVWILTAAQCVMNTTVSYLTIRLGSSSIHDSGTLFSVKAFHIHPKYDPETFQRDIALLRLTSPAKLGSSSISVIPLVKPGYGMEEGTRCSIPGWSEGVKAKLWSRERCQATVRGRSKSMTFQPMTDDALCAKITPSNVSSSSGQQSAVGTGVQRCDQQLQLHPQQHQLQQQQRFIPGSPLVCEGKQVAVVRQRSATSTTALAGSGHCVDDGRDLPDFFTDVAFADQWISSHTTVRRKRKLGKPAMAKIRNRNNHRNGGVEGKPVPGGVILVAIFMVCLGCL